MTARIRRKEPARRCCSKASTLRHSSTHVRASFVSASRTSRVALQPGSDRTGPAKERNTPAASSNDSGTNSIRIRSLSNGDPPQLRPKLQGSTLLPHEPCQFCFRFVLVGISLSGREIRGTLRVRGWCDGALEGAIYHAKSEYSPRTPREMTQPQEVGGPDVWVPQLRLLQPVEGGNHPFDSAAFCGSFGHSAGGDRNTRVSPPSPR